MRMMMNPRTAVLFWASRRMASYIWLLCRLASRDAGFAAAFEPAAQPVAEPAPAAPEAAVSESADDDFDLARIISDIQGQLDAEDEKNQ